MTLSNAIVLIVDRLGAGALGPYGNTWIESHAFNRLAAQSMVCETMLSDSSRLQDVYRSYWTGKHALCPATPPLNLPELLTARHVDCRLVTNCPEVAQHPIAQRFSEKTLHPTEVDPQEKRNVYQTQTALLIAEATRLVYELRPPFLLWVHVAAMSGAWDAPYGLREQFQDEDDPAPPRFVPPPDCVLEAGYDPDQLLGLNQAYAGELVAVDACLAALLDAIEQADRDSDTLFAVTSPRGYPLGEHGAVGPAGDHMYSELLQTPAFLRTPASRHQRLLPLAQPADLFVTIASALDALPADALSNCWGRDLLNHHPLHAWSGKLACSGDGMGNFAVRTPYWLLSSPEDGRAQLYSKPGDRWEVNEVADRCRPIVNQLEETLTQFQHAAQSDDPAQVPQIPEELIQEPDL